MVGVGVEIGANPVVDWVVAVVDDDDVDDWIVTAGVGRGVFADWVGRDVGEGVATEATAEGGIAGFSIRGEAIGIAEEEYHSLS